MKRFILYLLRWQCSSPLLFFCLLYLIPIVGELWATIASNLIGGAIFFYFDRFIFTSAYFNPLWEIKSNVVCADCNKLGYGFRIALKKGYDKTKESNPEFRCYECAKNKANDMGVVI
jgi:hypothetical protein